MIVVDASTVIESLLRSPTAIKIDARLFNAGETLHAPHLLDIEVMHVLRRHDMARDIDPKRAQEALDDYGDLPIRRYPHRDLLPRVWELRANLTAYDAVYVALAEVLDAPLVTRDRRLANATGHHARIELV